MKTIYRLILATAVVVLFCGCAKKPNYYVTFSGDIFSTTVNLIKTFDKMATDNINSFAIEDDSDAEKWIFQFEYTFNDCDKYIIKDRIENNIYETNARGMQKYIANIDFSRRVQYSFFEEMQRKMTQRTRQAHASKLGM